MRTTILVMPCRRRSASQQDVARAGGCAAMAASADLRLRLVAAARTHFADPEHRLACGRKELRGACGIFARDDDDHPDAAVERPLQLLLVDVAGALEPREDRR